jgi:hypothetical protein
VRLIGHALHVYSFDADASRDDDLRRRCVALGMTPVAGEPVWRDDTAPTTVEAIAVPGAMFVCRSGTGWPDLRTRWCATAPHVGEILGDVVLYLAHYPGVRRSWRTVRPVVEAGLGTAVGDVPTVPAPGCYLVEMVTADDVRTLVLVGPAGRAARSERWVWPAAVGVAPVPRYLWQANRLRHEQRVLADLRSDIRDRQTSVTAHVAAILAGGSGGGPAGAVDPTSEEELRHLQWSTAKAAADEARLRAQAVTVDAIVENSAGALPDWPTDGGGPFAADLARGRWLTAELSDEADRSQQAVALAEPITRAVLADNDFALRRLTERTDQRIAVQAAAIGAVLLVFATAQTISYRWPGAESLKLPFIAVLGLLALMVPLWAGRRPPARAIPRWLPAATAVLSAATGWLLTTGISRIVAERPAPAFASITVAMTSAAVTLLALRLLRR